MARFSEAALTNSRVILVATLTAPPGAAELAALAGRADVLEVRADLTGELDPEWLRGRFPGELLYTLRSRAEGGAAEQSSGRRQEKLTAAAAAYDLVDLEGARDLVPEVLEALPAGRRLISWHGPPATRAELEARLAELGGHQARLYKLVAEARQPGQELAPLAILRSQRRSDLIAFASGQVGAWTRLLAPRLGAPWIFAAAGEVSAAPGQPTLTALRDDFRLPRLDPIERLYGIVGRPVDHSLSPRLHNRLYEQLGLPALYLTFHVEAFGDFWLEVVESGSLRELGFHLAGLSVTAPHKGVALAVAGASSPLAERVGAANTLVVRDGVWEAETTDPEGVLGPLRARRVVLTETETAVLGAGGAGRAAAFALARAGARVRLVNRGRTRGERAAEELGLPFVPLEEFDPGRFGVVVHATPGGLTDEDPLPFDPARLAVEAVVVDLVYRRGEPTPLVRAARAAGHQAIDGREVLLHQAAPQFRLLTGRELPLGEGRRILGLEEPR